MVLKLLRQAAITLLTFFCIFILFESGLLIPLSLLPSIVYPTPNFEQHNTHHPFLPESEASSLCATHDLHPYPHRTHLRRIYDLIPLSTELDWLEIRLHELSPVVDYFIILEATSTFTGNPKPLLFKQNLPRFSHLSHKIIYHALDLSPLANNSTWEREAYTRNALYTAIFPSLLPPASPNPDDVILVSDTDEIPRPETLTMLRNCAFPARTTLRSAFYYYSFQWHHVGQDWHHPQATFYAGDKTILPEDLRMRSGGGLDIWNAGWHCSSCFSTVAELVKKIESFSHTEYNRPEFREPKEVVRRVRNGIDLFDREGEKYERVQEVVDVPGYLRENAGRFPFLLDRDPEDGNFVDYEV